MDKIRLGIIGTGMQGSYHIRYLKRGEVPQVALTAICDTNPGKLEAARQLAGEGVAAFSAAQELFSSGRVDAVLISTPHFSHPPLAIEAMQHGLHVMVEKPSGVYTKQVKELNAAAAKSDRVFGLMLNQRTNPVYKRLKELVESDELGSLKRTNWIITDWYRPQRYYDNGEWRGTWAGEGGGVLLNQNPHTLDLWQWICGMPRRIFAVCYNGKYHDIEVEDDVTIFAEYGDKDGATGVYVTTTGDAPGTNRLEVAGDKGKAVIEDGRLTFWRLTVPESEFSRTWDQTFGEPECWKCEIPVKGTASMHQGILRNWADAILHGTPLIAPGEEGIRGLEISNAIHLSAWTNRWVDLPVDEDKFYEELQKRVKASKYKDQ